MNKKATDYPDKLTELSKSVLLEIMTLLKGYSGHIVLVGGWVPYFLLQRYYKTSDFQHVGSADIDLVIDPALIKSGAYETIAEILEKNKYHPRKDRNGNPIEFSFEKDINGTTIHVDFLSAEYPNKTNKRHRMIQPDLKARTLKGAKIVMEHNYEENIEGRLPNNAEVKIKLKIADIVGSLATKAIVITERSQAKDYYDIYSLICNYKDGEISCAKEIKPFLKDNDIKEAIEEIKKSFEKETSLGPTLIGTFMHSHDEYAKIRVMTDSFMRINRFLSLLER